MTLPPLGTFVKCNWTDIVCVSGWTDKDKMGTEITPPHLVVSVGYLSYVGDTYIIVSSTMSTNDPDQYNNHISIPIGCIQDVKELLDDIK